MTQIATIEPRLLAAAQDELRARELAAIGAQEVTIVMINSFTAYLDAKPKTIATYARALRQFWKWLEESKIRQPIRDDVIRYREELKETHKASTVQNYIIAVRLFFRWTAQANLYPNIADHVKGAKVDRLHKRDALTPQQAAEILALQRSKQTIKGRRDYAILAAAMTAGLRTIEISRANVEDLSSRSGRTVLYLQGKGHDDKAEYVVIPQQAEAAIRAYLKARGRAGRKAPLFASVSNRTAGGRMATRSISEIVKDAFIEAGYDTPRLTAHSLRHTAGTLALQSGETIEKVQQMLRHADISTTMIYVHEHEMETNDGAQRVADAIFGSEPAGDPETVKQGTTQQNQVKHSKTGEGPGRKAE